VMPSHSRAEQFKRNGPFNPQEEEEGNTFLQKYQGTLNHQHDGIFQKT